jgi:sarcosine oxidase/L-pipecolate oxidase
LSGILPDRMKYSVTKPIHKKGDKMNPANYRPILLLTTFSKIIFKVLYIKIIGHFETHQLIVGNQFGLRRSTATEDAIYKLMNEILNASNNKTVAGSIFYLEKAFDSVTHDILISEQLYCGIMGKAKSFLQSYLQNRYLKVHITNTYLNSKSVSKWTKIKYGVTQGSILDPHLTLCNAKFMPHKENVFSMLRVTIMSIFCYELYFWNLPLIVGGNNIATPSKNPCFPV